MVNDYSSLFRGLPGAELVVKGLRDLAARSITEEALLVLVASPRLRRLGVEVSDGLVPQPYEHALYTLIEQDRGRGALSHYNSLLRRMVSFCRALERETSGKRVQPRWDSGGA